MKVGKPQSTLLVAQVKGKQQVKQGQTTNRIQDTIAHYQNLFKKAEKITRDRETEFYQKLQKDKEGEWLLTMLKQGTISDKVSALAMIIQRDPTKALSYMTSLLNMAKKKNRKQAEQSIGAVRDLFINHLLQDNAKLNTFSKNPLLIGRKESDIKDKDLMQAYYEHCIKEIYREYVQSVLTDMTHDDLEHYRKYALNCLEQLIEKKPEMEEVILGAIVNKLGDTSKKIQCHTIYLLIQLMKAHVQMTEIIVREVQLFMQRPGTKASHRYYAVAFLNRVAVSVAPKDEKVRLMLFKIYFGLFQQIIHQKVDGTKEKKVKNRALSKDKNKKAQQKTAKTPELGQEDNKVAELVLKGVNLLIIKCSSQHSNFISQSAELKQLISEETQVLFKLTHHSVFRIQIQTLKLLFQFAKASQSSGDIQIEKAEGDEGANTFTDRYYRALYEILLKVHLNKAAKLDEFFGLIFKSIKTDKDANRAVAFIKRLLQMCYLNEASFTAASMLIISEVLTSRDDIKYTFYSASNSERFNSSTLKRPISNFNGDDDEERFVDIDRLEEAKLEAKKSKANQQADGNNTKAKFDTSTYDALKREPKYANAHKSFPYELVSLTLHSHPTVRLWATQLAKGDPITYNGDPLLDFGLANFLDRIAYKNPKSGDKLAKFGQQRMADIEKPVNQYAFHKGEQPDQLRAEEQYLYKYLREKEPKKERKVADPEELDLEEGEDPEEEMFAQEAIKKEMKRLNGGVDMDDDDDDDLDMSDMESEGEQSQDEEEEDEQEEGEDGVMEESEDEEGDFFEGEDLSEVDIGEQEKEGSEGEVEEMGSGDDGYGMEEYGMEDDEEGEEEEEEGDNEFLGGKQSNKKEAKGKSVFADYEEFQHLLEDGLYEENNTKKFLPKMVGSKRPHHKRGGPRKGGKGGNKRQKKHK